jgi:hypothetical protein
MNRARATPAPGTQTAAAFSFGPSKEEAATIDASAAKLAADDLAATNYQSNQFPYVQALKAYGEGTTTGPGADFYNLVGGAIRTPLAKLGINVGPLSSATERADTLGKWLAALQSGNPLSGKSDAELAQVLKGSASTHINEVAGEDMVKAGQTLLRMNVAANREWHQLSPQDQAQYGTYLGFLRNFNQTIDRFSVVCSTIVRRRLLAQLTSGGEASAASQQNLWMAMRIT